MAWASTAVCAAVWPLRLRIWRISGVAWASDCCVPGRDLRDLEDVVAELAVDRTDDLVDLGAENAAVSSACSSWPLVTPVSTPPLFLVAVSIEYFLATAFQLWPASSAALAALACWTVFVRTIRMLRVSGLPNCVRCGW